MEKFIQGVPLDVNPWTRPVGRLFQQPHGILRAMILVGLTGGVATGKSTVAKMFKRCGAILIDADKLAREVVEPGKPAWRAIVKQFGKTVLNQNRSLDRQALGSIVFHNPKKRRQLERIIHPRVAREQQRLVRRIAKGKPRAVVIYEVPLLFEAGVDKRVDKILVVTADRNTQIARLKKRNGLSRAEALRRIRSQMPLAKKIQQADHVLNGTLPRPSLRKQVGQLFRNLRLLA
jgi:dephospho-CoA kinase